ncbi:hypothetical protein [Micromonospora sp. NPDC049645]|uniref:hypothetical protein n=1 Tax=Micromonospora sp. NPDC049645 TaxID=3155508 RepID=UPI0034207758
MIGGPVRGGGVTPPRLCGRCHLRRGPRPALEPVHPDLAGRSGTPVRGPRAGLAPPLALIMIGVWVVLLATLAGWAYRRDEGRRFS